MVFLRNSAFSRKMRGLARKVRDGRALDRAPAGRASQSKVGHDHRVEESIRSAKSKVNAGEFGAAAALGQQIIELAPNRREGYRILAESLAKGEADLMRAFRTLERGQEQHVLNDDMRNVHLWQIFRAAIRVEDVEAATRSGAALAAQGQAREVVNALARTSASDPRPEPGRVWFDIYDGLFQQVGPVARGTLFSSVLSNKNLILMQVFAPFKELTPRAGAGRETAPTAMDGGASQSAKQSAAEGDPIGALEAQFVKIRESRGKLGLWKKAGELAAVLDPDASKVLLEQLVLFAWSGANPYGECGMLLAGLSQKRAYNALVKSPERILAIDLLLAALVQSWEQTEVATTAFSILLGMEDYATCSLLLKQWQDNAPQNMHHFICHSRLAAARGDFEGSVEKARQAVEINPRVGATHRRLAHSHLARSAYGSALSSLQAAMEHAPRDAGVRAEVVRLTRELGAVRAFPPEPNASLKIVFLPVECDESALSTALDQSEEDSVHSRTSYLICDPDAAATLAQRLQSLETLPGQVAYWFGGTTTHEPSPASADWVLLPRDTLALLRARGARSGHDCLANLAANFRGSFVPVAAGTGADLRMPDTDTPDREDLRLVFTPAAASLSQHPRETFDPNELAGFGAGRVVVATPADWGALEALRRLDLTLIVLVPAGQTSDWDALDDAALADATGWIPYASSIVITELADEERFEDRQKIACRVHDTYDAGLDTALRVANQRICVAVGAGIGNILFATPLIRAIAEQTGQPVDIVVNSPVGSAVQVFGESRFVNLACTVDQSRKVVFDKVFVTSSFGNAPFGYRARQRVSQRPAFDFYSQTQRLNEAAYNFKSIGALLPAVIQPKSLAGAMFIRNFDRLPARTPGKAPVIGVSGPKKIDVWSRRQWPFFPDLVDRYVQEGSDIRAFGLPGEDIDGAMDCTSDVLRQSIRSMAACDVFICSDGGVFHMADALGLDTVAIFGPTSAIKNGPVNGRTTVLQSDMACAPCQFNQSFMDCQFAACMTAIAPAMVHETVQRRLDGDPDPALLGLPANAVNLPDSNFRFADTNLAASFRLAGIDKEPALRLFESAYRFARLERAAVLLDWAFQIGPVEERDWLRKARLALRMGDYTTCLQICTTHGTSETGKTQVEWLRIQLEALLKTKDYRGVLATWEASSLFESPAGHDSKAMARAVLSVARAFLLLGRWEEARPLLEKSARLDPDQPALQTTLLHFRGGGFGDAVERSKIEPEGKPSLLLLADGAAPKALRAWREHFSIYRRDRLEDADLDHFAALVRPADPDGTGQDRQWVAQQIVDGAVGREEVIPAVLARISRVSDAPSLTSRRVVVVAHHHLERWNPRGGERSTLNIVQRMQALGYEVLVVVENKKTEAVGCERYNGVNYVLSGRYGLKQTLDDVLSAWCPDAAVIYGETALRSYQTLIEHAVPYLMFPRDWQEICPRPYTNLLRRPPILKRDTAFYHVLAGAAQIVTNSNYVGEVIRHLHGLESINSYVPVEPPETANRHDPNGPILLVNPKKMGGGALMMDLARAMPHRRFRVVGDFDVPFPANVDVEPFFNGRYEDLYDGSSLFLFPLIGEDPCGTGRVVFEALHCGVPSISMRIGGMGEVLPDDWLVDGTEIEGWRNAIEQIMADPTASQRCGALLEKFDADTQFGIIQSCLERTLNLECGTE